MICFKIYTILDNEEEINQFLECCSGKFSKAWPTQPPSMCHNMSMGMPVSHLTRGWLPDIASTGSASRLNVSTRDFRVDFTPVLSLLCICSWGMPLFLLVRHASIFTHEACLCLRHASISTREACLLAGMLNYLIESLRQHQINCLIVLRTMYSMFPLTDINI